MKSELYATEKTQPIRLTNAKINLDKVSANLRMAILINGNIFYEEKLSHQEKNLALQTSIPLDKIHEKSFLDLSGYSDLNAHF